MRIIEGGLFDIMEKVTPAGGAKVQSRNKFAQAKYTDTKSVTEEAAAFKVYFFD